MRAIVTGVIVGSILTVTLPAIAQPMHPMGRRPELFRVAPRHLHFFHHRSAARFSYPLDYFGDDLGYEPPPAAPEVIVALPPAAPAPAPVTSERDERATVETTPSGVTIVRGPGSHHMAP